ncbi:MAG TPA: ATPase domain-containing protein, partial [Vicinamibacterales bacterium]|nr:ATPase domain-containing protein [Vicinamibacterales bacterium]
LSETTEELRHVAASHGWTLDGIDTYQLAPMNERGADEYTLFHPAEIELADLTTTVLKHIERVQPKRVVFDSLSELRLLARDPLRYRRQILGLKDFFARHPSTVLLLDDHSAGEADLQLRSLAHGVILLEHLPFEYGRARRRLRIIKLRAMAVIEGFHDFVIVRGGLTVFPQLKPQSVATARPQLPIQSGLPELDALVGGGLTWGTTTLFIGPAGVGKSTLAGQYLCGAANPQSKAAIFLFDERRATFVARCDAMGMRASERIASGHLIIEQVEPGMASPGEFAYTVRRCVEKEGVRLIGLDTLNGYLNAIPSTDTPIVRMHELLSYLNEREVATLIVLAQHGMVGASMPVPIDLSYLADAIIMLRFFEAAGEVRKAISVVKKRTGLHENSIRELRIGPDRVRVGPPLREFHGILTGVPQYTGPSQPFLSHDERPRG